MKKRRRDSRSMLIAKEQVVLSKERTILSFMRTALTFVGIGVVIVNLLRDAVFQIIGYALIIVGFIEIGESVRRLRQKQKVMDKIEKKTKV